MDLSTASRAGELAAKAAALQRLIVGIDLAIAEGWQLTVMRYGPPADSESKGTEIDILPFGAAGAESSAAGLKAARETYQATLDALLKELAAL